MEAPLSLFHFAFGQSLSHCSLSCSILSSFNPKEKKQKPVLALTKCPPLYNHTPPATTTPQPNRFPNKTTHLTTVHVAATIPYGFSG